MPKQLSSTDYRYLITPAPLLRTERIGRFAKDVWSVLYTYERMNASDEDLPGIHLSKPQIAALVGSSLGAIRRAFQELESAELIDLGRTESTSRQRSYISVRTLWPDWLIDGTDDLLIASVRRQIKLSSDSKAEDENEEGQDQTDPGGQDQTDPGGRIKVIPLNKGDKGKEERTSTTRDRSAVAQEIEEPDPDGDSPSTVAEQNEAAEKKKAHSPRRKIVKPLDKKFLREPSRREVFNNWRLKRGLWAARDVIGYFICRFKEISGRETPEFFGTTEGIFKTVVPNVRKYTERWLEGDYDRAKLLVDKILEGAEPRGMPSKLAYFFLPRSEAPALRLEEPVKGRAQTPAEKNDARGKYEGNEEYWDEQARKAQEKRERRERRKAEKDAS